MATKLNKEISIWFSKNSGGVRPEAINYLTDGVLELSDPRDREAWFSLESSVPRPWHQGRRKATRRIVKRAAEEAAGLRGDNPSRNKDYAALGRQLSDHIRRKDLVRAMRTAEKIQTMKEDDPSVIFVIKETLKDEEKDEVGPMGSSIATRHRLWDAFADAIDSRSMPKDELEDLFHTLMDEEPPVPKPRGIIRSTERRLAEAALQMKGIEEDDRNDLLECMSASKVDKWAQAARDSKVYKSIAKEKPYKGLSKAALDEIFLNQIFGNEDLKKEEPSKNVEELFAKQYLLEKGVADEALAEMLADLSSPAPLAKKFRKTETYQKLAEPAKNLSQNVVDQVVANQL